MDYGFVLIASFMKLYSQFQSINLLVFNKFKNESYEFFIDNVRPLC